MCVFEIYKIKTEIKLWFEDAHVLFLIRRSTYQGFNLQKISHKLNFRQKVNTSHLRNKNEFYTERNKIRMKLLELCVCHTIYAKSLGKPFEGAIFGTIRNKKNNPRFSFPPNWEY